MKWIINHLFYKHAVKTSLKHINGLEANSPDSYSIHSEYCLLFRTLDQSTFESNCLIFCLNQLKLVQSQRKWFEPDEISFYRLKVATVFKLPKDAELWEAEDLQFCFSQSLKAITHPQKTSSSAILLWRWRPFVMWSAHRYVACHALVGDNLKLMQQW